MLRILLRMIIMFFSLHAEFDEDIDRSSVSSYQFALSKHTETDRQTTIRTIYSLFFMS